MSPQQRVFEHWAPAGAPWATWAKPVLFAKMPAILTPVWDAHPSRPALFDVSWSPAAAQRVAIVVDLPGAQSVNAGLALAQRGYRPVPLFNCVPGPLAAWPMVAIEAVPIMEALWRGATYLDQLNLVYEAPPAFLLDSNRRAKSAPPPGGFDNRWVVLPQDFPSVTFLLSQNVRSALLVQDQPGQPREDLAHVLRRWQDGGVAIESIAVAPGAHPHPMALRVNKPPMFRSIFYLLLATFGLRRSSAGGFGSVVPMPSSG
jgi:hypothetical protein